MARQDTERRRLTITGQVQGVGFRPFVYRLARELALTGWVNNDSSGVTIELQGPPAQIDAFARRLPGELPPLAQIETFQQASIACTGDEAGFEIYPSSVGELADAQVTVDTAVCADCLAEMNDPSDPRYRYPFINCTNCGPRYTIVRDVPYDRPNTTMADFGMCRMCARQYQDPADRRFHAQPIACAKCGPAVWLVDSHGKQIDCEDAIRTTAAMLAEGKIVAIKGLGGFHLACRGDTDHVVRRLRRRKHRDAKPLALMVANLDEARQLCQVSDEAEGLLTGSLRPIVVMPAIEGAPVAKSVSEGLSTLAVMLPYTPLHHLLLAEHIGPLVMTSGNYSDEPLVKDNDAALSYLGAIADAVLLHNRAIARRLDDSVVQSGSGVRTLLLRRARGYAPRPASLPAGQIGSGGPAILAVGGELKNTICLAREGRAVVSEHIGDLTDGRAYRHFIDTIGHLERLFDVQPKLLAADMHPQYLSSQYALKWHRGELAGRGALGIVRVQHHHAHIAACMVENGRSENVIGLACDGAGYGDDGTTWGCEVLRANLVDYERLGHMRPMSLIGGDAAAKETYRPAVAVLYDAFGEKTREILSDLQLAGTDEQIRRAGEILQAGIDCPQSSSLGRWFDAVACICQVAWANRFEGEAPMRLEEAATDGVDDVYAFGITSASPFVIDFRGTVEGIVFDLLDGAAVGEVSAKFHNTIVRSLAAAAKLVAEQTQLSVVALSGGCFANRRITDRLLEELAAAGLETLIHTEYPCNDGSIALGQAAVALARSNSGPAARQWAKEESGS